MRSITVRSPRGGKQIGAIVRVGFASWYALRDPTSHSGAFVRVFFSRMGRGLGLHDLVLRPIAVVVTGDVGCRGAIG